MDAQRSGGAKAAIVLTVVALLAILLVMFYVWRPSPDEPQVNGEAQREYATAIRAVSATEEAQFSQAIELWEQLIEADPADATYKLNLAVTVLKWIDQVNGALSSSAMDAERQQELQQELATAYTQVESAVAALESANTNDYRASFVQASLLERQAERAAGEGTALLKQAADILLKQLTAPEKNIPPSGYLLLAAKFDQLAGQLEPDYPALQQQNADFLLDAFRREPRNLYLLKRASEVLIANEDPRLKELLTPSLELARPMMAAPNVVRLVERLQPDALMPKTAAAIDAGKWSDIRQIRGFQGWLNTIVSMSGFIPDGRLAKPDVLALLETRFLYELADQATDGVDAQVKPLPQWETQELPFAVQAVAWYDIDADLEFDVVAGSGNDLLLLANEGNQLNETPVQRIDIGMEVRGILPVDLFEVQGPARPLLPTSVRELMQSNAPQAASPANEQTAAPEATNRDESAEDTLTPDRHDTLQELVVWGAAGVRVVTQRADDLQFELVTTATGLEDLTAVRNILPFDIESDGDLDLVVLCESQVRIMQNRGNRSFEEISQYSTLPSATTAAVVVDMDRDTDQDVVYVSPEAPRLGWLENILHGQLRAAEFPTGEPQEITAAADLAVADFDGNGSWDIVVVGPAGTSVLFTTTLEDQTVHARSLVETKLVGTHVEVADLNNDGIQEIIVAGPEGIQVLQGSLDDQGNFALAKESQTLALQGREVTDVQVADANRDGAIELLAIAEGKLAFCRAQSVTGRYSLVRVAGIDDNNGGGRVNHYAIGSTLEMAAGGRLISRIVDSPMTHFGLGDLEPSNLRIIFPNGLTQNVQQINTNVLIEEKQVLRGSCPYVYGWNGERFELITDLLWNAPLGLQIARGQSLPDRRWENLLLPGELVQPRDGKLELQVTEELWEVAYFDHIELTAIDHPDDIRVFTNEKVGPGSMAEHRLFAVRDQLSVQAARDSHGRNVTDTIQSLDGRRVQAFDQLICQGLAEPHYVELNFGELPTKEHELYLFLTGWMYPTDTSLNIGIDQNPERSLPEPPSLWVVDEAGDWVCAQPFIGFPGGKTKSIAVPLKDVFRSSDHRLRIAGSQQIYWDEAFVGWHAGDEFVREQRLTLSAADLHYRGFSGLLPRAADQPHWFDYQQTSTAPNWPQLEGPFTRFGDVADLLREDDDRMVVMVSGDEISLEFELPPLDVETDWSRDYVMHSTGWDKDADLNTIAGQGSLPLPFMSQTEYPASLEQATEAEAVWTKNAETLTRMRSIPARNQGERPLKVYQ